MLEARSLTSIRNERLIQEEISFFLDPGSILKITGPNGVGKSTILKMISGYLPICEGSLVFKNKKINEDSVFFKQNICYLGHRNPLKENLTCLENYKFLSDILKISNMKFKEKFNIKKFENKLVSQCSEGQKKKIALSSILNEDKKIWLLDEPFSNLDNNAVNILLDILEKRSKQKGIIIIVTHQNLPINNSKELKLSFPKKNYSQHQIDKNPFLNGDWD